MPNLPSGCEYPSCPCTYPNCAPREERQEWKQTQREIAYIDQRTQDYHEWRNRE